MRITERMIQTAKDAAQHFETRDRNGAAFTALKDERPEWLQDAVREAHSGMMPDDTKYQMCRDAVDFLADSVSEGTDVSDAAHEFADGNVSVYTSDRAEWLASHPLRFDFVDRAQQDGYTERGASLDDMLGAGWYMEALEVFNVLADAIREAAEEDEEGDDE